MTATDAHCHIDRFSAPEAVLERAQTAGVTVFAVTCRPSEYEQQLARYGERPGLRLGLGFHPMAVAGRLPWAPDVDIAAELEIFQRLAAGAAFIGEVGLDFTPNGRHARQAQESVIDTILATPGVLDKYITVHSRGAETEVVDRLRDAGAQHAALHGNGFLGTPAQIERATDAGIYFSVVLSDEMALAPGFRDLIAAVPRDRALSESDGPFGQTGGRELEPTDMGLVHEYLARQWHMSTEVVVGALAGNLKRLAGD